MSEETVRRLLMKKRDRLLPIKDSLLYEKDDADGIDQDIPEEYIDQEDSGEDADDMEASVQDDEQDSIDSEDADDINNDEKPVNSDEEEHNKNPLDNPYAVNYQLGDQVTIGYSNGTHMEMTGIIEGYDKEGFYRIKWDNGHLSNGFTDIALAEFMQEQNENTCICGSNKRIIEGTNIVCDRCGRILGDATNKKIQSIKKPVSTSRPSIEESIRNSMKVR